MKNAPVYISGAGIISSLGSGLSSTEKALRENISGIRPLSLFSLLQAAPLPVGQVEGVARDSSLPRTHALARIAAEQAMQGWTHGIDAVVLGTTTGGILTSEELLRQGCRDRRSFRYHGLHTVAEYIAGLFNCSGPALSVSTACSSGVAAIALAMRLLRSGRARAVLAGGVDSLCRLTYFGFHSLQLVDAAGCRPLDIDRRGMAVAEGAGMLLLTGDEMGTPLAVLLGAGLSCDAYHAAAPHPEGEGAHRAMSLALADAGVESTDIDYINLHGTGTADNDLAESKAVRRLFAKPPPLSSIKGATGHSLAAAGAIEAVIAALSISSSLLPANTGLATVDPALGLAPLTTPRQQALKTVLTNSFGFGGNNGSLVVGQKNRAVPLDARRQVRPPLFIHGCSCLSGAGLTEATVERLKRGRDVAGTAALELIAQALPPRLIRRLKRLPQMALSLAADAFGEGSPEQSLGSVFVGTGWGALSETYDFLSRLADSGEQFPSPTDFVGSVHNAPAGQLAIRYGATGANITAAGGDYSFEQSLLAAELLIEDAEPPALVVGADEAHTIFSPLLDPSVDGQSPLADGGGALLVSRSAAGASSRIRLAYYGSGADDGAIDELIGSLDCLRNRQRSCVLVLAGIPAAMRRQGERQLKQFLAASALSVPVVDCRRYTGEFATAAAVSVVLGVRLLEDGIVPPALTELEVLPLDPDSDTILVLSLGSTIAAMELAGS